MKTENTILHELLQCYQKIIPTNQRSEKIKTLEWVLADSDPQTTTDDQNTPSHTDTADDDNCDERLEFPDCLTEREREFYGLMREHPELTPKDIADIMECSIVTARKHYNNIREKMGWGD